MVYTRDMNKKYMIRVPEDLYYRIKEIAAKQQRSVQVQSEILLESALNRNLIYPDTIENKEQ